MSRYNLFMHPPPLSFHLITSPDAVGLLPLFSFVQADTGYHSSHHETSMCPPHLDWKHAWHFYKVVFFCFIQVSCHGVLSNKIRFFIQSLRLYCTQNIFDFEMVECSLITHTKKWPKSQILSTAPLRD